MKIKRDLNQNTTKPVFRPAVRASIKQWALAAIITISPMTLEAFDSGSTGVDGAFTPTVSQTVVLPADGILNYTVVNIPSDVTIKFARNDNNAPAVILAQGDVVIDGIIDVSGNGGTAFGDARGGPGGFNGGIGAINSNGGNGFGPGGGAGGFEGPVNLGCGGLGAGYALQTTPHTSTSCIAALPGNPYGSTRLIPLIGGSGGGAGGASVSGVAGLGGGGGGGAILIASSTSITLNGSVISKGGPGSSGPDGSLSTLSGAGGGGSGGAIRIIATNIAGGGTFDVSGGLRGQRFGNSGSSQLHGRSGSHGRIRLEAEVLPFTGNVLPLGVAGVISNPSDVFIADFPTLKISSVGGQIVSDSPNGYGDVFLPADVTNPITIEIAATDVPIGSVINITATPTIGTIVGATSTPLAGTDASSTASTTITLPLGPSTLTASVSYVVTVGLGSDKYSDYAMGEQVERVKISVGSGQGSETTFITISGKEYTWPSNSVVFR